MKSRHRPPRIRISIRSKLLLASLSLLVVPWLGYHYIQGLESWLRSAQEQRLLDRVAVVASVMDGQKTLFKQSVAVAPVVKAGAHIYVRPLRSAIQLDGYADDWMVYQDRERLLGDANDEDFRVRYRLGVWKEFLYLFLQISDDQVIYRRPDSLYPGRSDHLRIGLQDPQGKFKRYRLTTISPGWVNAYRMPNSPKKDLPLRSEFRIKGEWQEVPGGYNLEIRIPVGMVGDKFSFAVADVDDATTRRVENIAGSANTERLRNLGTIVIPTAQMESLLQRLQKSQSRIWVVDPAQRVIGLVDSLGQSMPQTASSTEVLSWFDEVMRVFYRLLLRQPNNVFHDALLSASRLDDPAVVSALSGSGRVSWRQTDDEQVSVITAAQPIYIDGKVVGAVAIEETSNSILILQNRAIEALVNMSLLAFVLTIGVLLAFATRLSLRVRRLRDEVEASIADDGRIQGEIKPTRSGDELGDLGRSFHDMHERLAQYNRYLETMAGKLSHELRTPITIVRSSLDNLQTSRSDEDRHIYIKRANDGVQRLSGILTRMSEATHLEQTLQQEETTPFDVAAVVSACVDGYGLAHPQQVFELDVDVATATVTGSPELLAQLLDKLVSNALDFAKKESAISIAVHTQAEKVILSVANRGPVLPQEMRASLFDSMVSMRQGKGTDPHLGLGLYIVRLIVEYHHGHVDVQNLPNDKGVIFSVILPRS